MCDTRAHGCPIRAIADGKAPHAVVRVPENHARTTLGRHDFLCRTVRTVENGVGSSAGLLPFDHSALLEDGDVYQFGVFQGGSLSKLVKLYNTSATWGFDTFSGLPAELPGEHTIRGWKPGTFDVGGKAAAARVARSIGLQRGGLIAGLFNVTLTPELTASRGMRPAVYVDVDSDLYVSAAQALDWLFAQRLAVPGTVIGYDDWWVLPCIKQDPRPLAYGEGKAHLDVARRHGVRFRCICGPCAPRNSKMWGWRPYFLVEAVGVTAEPGVAAQLDAADFLRSSKNCQKALRRSGGPVKEK
jgi:hypothetical protein